MESNFAKTPPCLWLVALLMILGAISVNGRNNFLFKRIEHCDPSAHYSAKFNIAFKNVDGKAHINGTLVLEKPIDDNVRSNLTVEKLVNRKPVHLFSFPDANACDAINKYVGEVAYDLERRVGLIPGMCPIPKGTYRLRDYVFDFNRMPLQAFPFGNVLITEVAQEKNNNIFACLVVEVENR